MENLSETLTENPQNDEEISEKTDEIQEKTEKIDEIAPEPSEPTNKCKSIGITALRIFGAVVSIYVFIFSIGLLSDAFQILGGAFLNEVIKEIEDLLNSPYTGICLGVLLTVLCQSSSTSTSIFITLAAADLFTVQQSIYAIYGANIGTSITSTIVAFGNVASKTEFRNAVSCAVLAAGFNVATLLILLPCEMLFDMMDTITFKMTQGIDASENGDEGGTTDPIAFITEPIQQYIITMNKEGLGNLNYTGSFVEYCRKRIPFEDCVSFCDYGVDCERPGGNICIREGNFDCEWNGLNSSESFDILYGNSCTEKEIHMFTNACWSDEAIGGTCLGIAFVLMFASLGSVVKCLKAVLEGSITELIHENIDKNLPYPFGWLTEYLYVMGGLLLTLAVQSSSIILAIMTPIVGIGVISIERCYPITVGSKIGTTITGILAALANTGYGFRKALQVAISHVLFNGFGFAFFFIIPITRELPIQIAIFSGKRAEKYRWWAVVYGIMIFLAVPLLLFFIGIGSAIGATVFLYFFVLLVLFIKIIDMIRERRPKMLPSFLRSWKWLPSPFRSLEPYDRLICSNPCCCCSSKVEYEESNSNTDVSISEL